MCRCNFFDFKLKNNLIRNKYINITQIFSNKVTSVGGKCVDSSDCSIGNCVSGVCAGS